jgi:branched-chain amino acid transport system ATP-binding protein
MKEPALSLLETQLVSKRFGGVSAVKSISLTVERGEIVGMIGPNGSGKSSFINLLSGIYKPDEGKIVFDKEDITNLPSHIITRKGIARTFQNLRVFSNISILDNLLIGRHCKIDNSLLNVFGNPFSSSKIEKEAVTSVLHLLEMVNLTAKKSDFARNLPYGEQRLLEICRALASEPKLILLDEPCAGMNPVEVEALANFLKNLQKRGTTIFIIEHNMKFIMSLAKRIIVLNAGEKFREGNPLEIQNDLQVQRIYLGEEEGV